MVVFSGAATTVGIVFTSEVAEEEEPVPVLLPHPILVSTDQ